MAKSRIKNLSDLLKEHIGNKTIINVKETPLVSAGENYGSFLLRLDITLRNEENNEEEELNIVAKLNSEDSQARKPNVKKEILFYTVIVPALEQFQRERGITDVVNCFPKFYGGRLNLHGNDETVDGDAVILLENLVASGFENVDRLQGYDLESAKTVLQNLAWFHAVSIAMKLKDSEKFEETIKANCIIEMDLPPPPDDFFEDEKSCEKNILEILCESEKCLPYIDRLKPKLHLGPPRKEEDSGESHGPHGPPPNEPWGTLFHSDMWVNNQLLKFENGKPSKSMMIDFEMYGYSSPTNDLFFFLWTSIQKSVLEKHLDDLIKYYHDCFTKILLDFDCDVTPFSFPEFLKELTISSNTEFMHSLGMMCIVIFGKKGGNSKDPTKPNFKVSSKDLSLSSKERIWYTVQECGKRNWI